MFVLAAVLLIAIVVIAVAKSRADQVFYAGYDASVPLNTELRADESSLGYRRIDLTFDGLPGESVPTLLGLPSGDGPFPCVIFLHGIGQDKSFLDTIAPIFTDEGFAIATFDQYTRGERHLGDVSVIGKAFGLRRRAAVTVLETRRMVDYLESRQDIDRSRIYLLGASFGAITGSTAAAFEPRIRAVVLTYGGGDLPKLFASEQAKAELGAVHGAVAAIAGYLMAPADPIHHIANIAPRPVLFQNGEEDSIIPPNAARALHHAASEPKEIVWYAGDHIGPDDEHVDRVLRDTVHWLHRH
jgi:dienelactone hydrolase